MSTDSFNAVVRGAWRCIVLLVMLLATIGDFLLKRPVDLRAQSELRRQWCARILRALDITVTVEGDVPSRGVVASNHLSYVDILTFGAIFGGVFVSKREVRSWPLIGLFTRLAGTIYVDRKQREKSPVTVSEMRTALAKNLPVMFFPEGTSSDGSFILRFRAALFQAAIDAEEPVFPASVSYRIAGSHNGVAEQVCYFGDMTFFPHLLRFLRLRDVSATIRFGKAIIEAQDRFDLAQQAQRAVGHLSETPLAPDPEPPASPALTPDDHAKEHSLSAARP